MKTPFYFMRFVQVRIISSFDTSTRLEASPNGIYESNEVMRLISRSFSDSSVNLRLNSSEREPVFRHSSTIQILLQGPKADKI